jgi:hypothetical protein
MENDDTDTPRSSRHRPMTGPDRHQLRRERIDTYRRLMDAETRLDAVRERRGLDPSAIGDALDAIEGDQPAIDIEDDLYLRVVSQYVAELGGRLEVRAVFSDENVLLLDSAGLEAR